MKLWENIALDTLEKSLTGVPTEYNELDWKSDISDNSEKLAKHLSAFSHLKGGGFLVYGVNNDGSFTKQIIKGDVDEITRKLANIGANNLSESVSIDHAVLNYKGYNLLFIYVPESHSKPVYLRGTNMFECFKRSAGNTIKMTRADVKSIIATSQNISFEEQIAFPNISDDIVLKLLDIESYYRLSGIKEPKNKYAILDNLKNEKFITKTVSGSWDITNLGAITFSKNLKYFPGLNRKSIRVILYDGVNKIKAIKEQVGTKGYASAFEGLLKFIKDLLPTNEIIEDALRKEVKMYPEVAIREFVANALIHQDFNITGTGVMIEIYKDRIEITNPGAPLVDINRFIDTPPQSRNEY